MRRLTALWAFATLVVSSLINPGAGTNQLSAQDAVKPVQEGVTTEQITSPQSFGPSIEWVSYDLFQPSDHGFDSFISPMTNLVYFEDPRALTEIRPFFFNHKVPLAAGGGSVQLYGAQIRMRLTENISLIAIKDGYATTSNAILDNGWADIAAGLKFTLLRDCDRAHFAHLVNNDLGRRCGQ